MDLHIATHSAFFERHGLITWDTIIFWKHPLPSAALARIVKVISRDRQTVTGGIRRVGSFGISDMGVRFKFVFNITVEGEASLMIKEEEMVSPVEELTMSFASHNLSEA
ncbi:uncharacterized protein MELLADRAFT_103231 [Melampsora larici-populina 98AG31]|uniref:Uncharacterized protein n=1 Tax=Melampsora larici-populina (strain 98AG31 / pathotype 3-4-7) TaxID=747676 RepID=F4RAZ5_MELLP|nr:uncharacterized protein MELLADRAFT_103231 [Melampsora larici-populina 98AG31]EGG10562.1 hypothetical protein MELLADRAFT_103231 [Melampsora larici-populina 98AG31]